jgi:hypothetical protein
VINTVHKKQGYDGQLPEQMIWEYYVGIVILQKNIQSIIDIHMKNDNFLGTNDIS